MSHKPEVRIKVTDVDRLLLLTESQLKVWLYYKRREGANKKAWGKAQSIAEATRFTNLGTVKNARAWLVKHGWLKPNGWSDLGLPMFLAVIPEVQVSSENDAEVGSDRQLEMTPPVISGLLPPSFENDTEVPTLKKQSEKDSALTSGKSLASELVSETSLVSLATSFQQEKQKPSDGLWDRQQEQEQLQKQPHLYWSDALRRGLDIEEIRAVSDLYLDLLPNGNMKDEDLVLLAELAISYGKQYLRSIWAWNHRHKDKGLRFRSIPHFADALASGSDGSVCTQYADHEFSKCPKCKKLERCRQCGELQDMTTEWTSSDPAVRAYLHKGCVWQWGKEPTYLQKTEKLEPNTICCQLGYNSGGVDHAPNCQYSSGDGVYLCCDEGFDTAGREHTSECSEVDSESDPPSMERIMAARGAASARKTFEVEELE